MNSDDAVGRALKALADADAARHASPHVESALLAAFDRQKVRASSPRFVWPAVIAAIILVPLAVAVYRQISDPVEVSPPSSGHIVSTNQEREMVGQTVQLRLPRSALPLLGIPIIAPEIEGIVNVELLLTEDGQARTIRIVQ